VTADAPTLPWRRITALPQAVGSALVRGRGLVHPVALICAVQAALSLTLVWSNTAFADEAEYLWVGHLVIGHWLHGTPWPVYEQRISGSPMVYPPLGAMADSVGGLAGARLLSLAFMLAATVLLYLTATRLLGRRIAIIAAALWALSEPALRLAFATYDPLSVSLTALSAWLAVEAGYRRHRWPWVTAAAAALGLANMTAYSGIVIDPVVIAVAFFGWLPRMAVRQAARLAALLAGGCVAFFCLAVFATGSWTGTRSVFHRAVTNPQSFQLILNDVWKYSALIIVLAVMGAVAAIGTEERVRAALLVVLGGAVLVVPAAQLHYRTAFSIDKHLAYGIWFAVMAAAYGCTRLISWLPGGRARVAALCFGLALIFPAVTSWESAWQVDHGWPNARSFVTSFRPVVAHSRGLIYASGPLHIGEYYTPQGSEWARWSGIGLSLDPVFLRNRSAWPSYYRNGLRSHDYGVVALFYTTTFQTRQLPANILLSPGRPHIYNELLGLVGYNSGQPGLPELTLALEADPSYRLVAVGPYDSGASLTGYSYGLYAIWRKVGPG
jgi:dolichyl-phosphate-mannose-protein mannosyltransferase